MPLGVVSREQFEQELSKSNSHEKTVIPSQAITPEIIPLDKSGRKSNDLNVPSSLRKVIGATAIEDSPKEAVALAQSFGISKSSASAYANGSTSTATYNEGDAELRKHINGSKLRIVRSAKNRLIFALNEITPARLAAAKIKDVSSIAKDMSSIIKDMEPEQSKDADVKPPQFVVFAPQFLQENHFETITLNEE